jgi:2-dehydro-3-deoxyphosphogluconate aldolase/(4S)-4-hydroxy-2-oxoglutarate aldolase
VNADGRELAASEIGRRRVVAVVRAPNPESAVSTAAALVRGGVTAIEITYTTPDAARAIREVAELSDVLVGAGTVTTAEQAREALEAGATFLVSPSTSLAVLDVADESDTLALPGVMTPTEIMAVADRAPLLKLFPASVGGVAFLKSLLGPFPDLRLVPTGGVTVANAAEWLSAGAFAVGAGGDLCPASAIAAGDFEEIERRAIAYTHAVSVHA